MLNNKSVLSVFVCVYVLPSAGAPAAASETVPGFAVAVAQPVDEKVSC